MATAATEVVESSPRVFISYTHDSPDHNNRVLELADKLCESGIDTTIDQYELDPPDGWPAWMEKQIRDSDFVLIVCTSNYQKRALQEVSPPVGLGARWEGRLVYQHLYERPTASNRFLAIVFSDEDIPSIPTPLRAGTRYDLSKAEGYEQLFRRLTNSPSTERPALGELRSLPPKPRYSQTQGPDDLVKDVVGQLVDLKALSPNFPAAPPRELPRDHIVHTIESFLASDIDLVTIEGEAGIGKTTAAAQFVRALPDRAISIFVRAASRLSYDTENIRLHLADQLFWAIYQERAPKTDIVGVELKYLYTELQRKARRKHSPYYFVVDGLTDIPQNGAYLIGNILDLLPIGEEGFKFVLTGDLRSYSTFLHKTLPVKSFPLVQFSLDDTIKYFEDLSTDRELIQELHRICKAIPGRLADVRRSAIGGTSLKECLGKLSERNPQLFALEWQKVNRSDEIQTHILALLAHDDKNHTLLTIGNLTGYSESAIATAIRPLSFISLENENNQILFVSDAFRKYAADQLRTLKNWVHKVNIKHLSLRPESDEALLELPLHLTETADFETLLQYLTPQHLIAMLRRTHNLPRVQATIDSGLISAKRLERDADMLRFGLEESILVDFLASGIGITEAEALVSLGDFVSATALANAALLREDRLHILAIIGKEKRKNGSVLDAELAARGETPSF